MEEEELNTVKKVDHKLEKKQVEEAEIEQLNAAIQK